MATFSTSHIPNTINTYEKLIVWAMAVMKNLNPTVSINEISGLDPEKQIQFTVTQLGSGDIAVITRSCIKLSNDWNDGSGKIWTKATEISSVADIPTAYKS